MFNNENDRQSSNYNPKRGELMTIDYNEKLAQEYGTIRDKVKRGMLPLVARNPAIEKATKAYAEAQADYYHARRDEATEKNRSPDLVPIPYRDNNALDRFADLILHEELTWSHPDKMSIIAYPVMSGWQEAERSGRFFPNADLKYGDMRFKGKRKVASENKNGAVNVSSRRLFEKSEDGMGAVDDAIDVQEALNTVGLTERQRQAIDLIYFDKLTQGDAGVAMGVSQQAVAKFERAALTKLHDYMTKV